MTLKEKALNLSKKLFLILVLLIPLNLGKHFEIRAAYVWGILVDYLIPTIYIQDILAVLIFVLWVFSGGIKKLSQQKILNRKEIQFAVLFVFSTLFSVMSAQRFVPALYFWFRLLLYFLLFIYVLLEILVEDYFLKVLDLFAISVIFVSILGIAQYFNRGAIFNNYLILGEQPYSASTWGVARKYFLGHVVVPAYGLFRHPNTFGGFLSVVLVWLLAFIKKSKRYRFAVILGFFALVFTFSFTAWIVFLFGALLHFLFSLNPTRIYLKKVRAAVLIGLFSLFMFIIPLLSEISQSKNPSLFRRSNLLVASYRVIKDYPLFGVGLNNLTVFIDKYAPESSDIRFTQPVHNVFALVFAEAGVFSFAFFGVFLFFAAKKLLNSSYFHVLLISLLQIIMLFSLDHYFFTINQTQLLFWIILGLTLQ